MSMRAQPKPKAPTYRKVDVPRMLRLLGIETKNQNGELWGNCPHPDHNENTPSWSIRDNGQHHCFGCKWEGGPVELVMRSIGLAALSSAISWMEDHGLFSDGALPLDVEVVMSRPSLDVHEVAIPADARFKPLDKWVTPAKRYAIERGITAEQIERWGLGYACGGWFANRMLFPTRTSDGRLINITGRTWLKQHRPKYLNSKAEHHPDPAAVFGEQYWPELRAQATLVVTEGEINALACERVGAMFVGALGGSELHKEQLLKISSFGTIILATDLDKAGSELSAALRATLVRWRHCRPVAFPDRRDPSDWLIQDPAKLRRLLWATGTTRDA